MQVAQNESTIVLQKYPFFLKQLYYFWRGVITRTEKKPKDYSFLTMILKSLVKKFEKNEQDKNFFCSFPKGYENTQKTNVT